MSVKKLLEKVLTLEARLGLPSTGLPYSERLLVLIKALEASAGHNALPDSLSGNNSNTLEGALAAVRGAMVPKQEGVDPELSGIKDRIQDANINDVTMLATDYLNHFNEIIMVLDMLPMMPEMIDDARDWKGKTYQQHFEDSQFSDKALAIEAYNHAPERYKEPFEETISQLEQLILSTIKQLDAYITAGETDLLEEAILTNGKLIQDLLGVASAIVHGSTKTMNQDEIDNFLC